MPHPKGVDVEFQDRFESLLRVRVIPWGSIELIDVPSSNTEFIVRFREGAHVSLPDDEELKQEIVRERWLVVSTWEVVRLIAEMRRQ